MKGIAVAESECDENDWESAWTEKRFELAKKSEVEDLIIDDCDKHDDNNFDDDCGDTTSCSFLITDSKRLDISFFH